MAIPNIGDFDPAGVPTSPVGTTSTAPEIRYPIPPQRPNFEEEERQNAREAGEEQKESGTSDGTFQDDAQTADLTQRGQFIRPSAMGDHSASGAHSAFGNVLNIASSVLSIARSVKSLSNSGSDSQNTGFRLTPDQVRKLESRARSISSLSDITYSAVEDFLYILCTIDSYEDFRYILLTVGLIELDNPENVRNVDVILDADELDRVSTLAAALEAINAEFDDELNNQGPESSFSQFTNPGSSSASSPSFGGIQNILSIGTEALNIANAVKGLTTEFGDGTIPDLLDQIQTIPNVVQQLLTNITKVKSAIQALGNANIGPMADQLAELNLIEIAAKTLDRVSKQLEPIEELAGEDSLITDVRGQLTDIKERSDQLQQRLNQVLSEISSITPPGNFAQLIEQVQGVRGFNLFKTIVGQVPTIQVLSQNPLLKEPNGIGLRYFGQSQLFLHALDQVFARRVALFSNPSNAAGSSSFEFQTSPAFSGPTPLSSVLSKVIAGSISGPAGNLIGSVAGSLAGNILSNVLDQKTNDIANLLGVAANAAIELRRPDNAIPFMISTAAALANETQSPFGTRVFSEGWQLANSVRNFIRDTQGRQ